MAKNNARGSNRRAVGGTGDRGRASLGTLVVGLVVLGFLGGFGALVWYDSRQNPGPPEGVESFEDLGRDHVGTAVSYEQTPPVGGDHNGVWQNQGFYEEPVRDENAVHTLEHGAVWIAYAPELPEEGKDRIRELVEGRDCVLASPYPDLPQDATVVASAWGKQLAVESADDPALEDFVRSFRRGPQTPEPGATCSSGTAETA